jgi:hypothetical protein
MQTQVDMAGHILRRRTMPAPQTPPAHRNPPPETAPAAIPLARVRPAWIRLLAADPLHHRIVPP